MVLSGSATIVRKAGFSDWRSSKAFEPLCRCIRQLTSTCRLRTVTLSDLLITATDSAASLFVHSADGNAPGYE